MFFIGGVNCAQYVLKSTPCPAQLLPARHHFYRRCPACLRSTSVGGSWSSRGPSTLRPDQELVFLEEGAPFIHREGCPWFLEGVSTAWAQGLADTFDGARWERGPKKKIELHQRRLSALPTLTVTVGPCGVTPESWRGRNVSSVTSDIRLFSFG